MFRILAINPGSTSTKIAVYNDDNQVYVNTIRHSLEELKYFQKVSDQYTFRKKLILHELTSNGIDLDFSVVVGRGGLLKPIESGVYTVNDKMISDLTNPSVREHASNLGAILAKEIASTIPNCQAFIVDPVVVDELQEVARISGLPQIPRRSAFHALNQKAVARRYAAENNTSYEKLNLVIAHLGGGISVSAHRLGRVVDTNQALGGTGAFSPERVGTLDASDLVNMCFEGKYTEAEIRKMLVGKGGLIAHLGTNDVEAIAENAIRGDEKSKLILEAMAYNVAKEIGAMLVVLGSCTDAVILTGGIANNQFVVRYIQQLISPFANVCVFPGEDEMSALAAGVLRVLQGEEAKIY